MAEDTIHHEWSHIPRIFPSGHWVGLLELKPKTCGLNITQLDIIPNITTLDIIPILPS